MKVREILNHLDGNVIVGEDLLDEEITSAASADMMSDVLAFSKDHSVLLSGLCNAQVIRTCEMLDIHCIIMVRGKIPTEEMQTLAKNKGIALITTDKMMFTASGILYEAGLRGGAI